MAKPDQKTLEEAEYPYLLLLIQPTGNGNENGSPDPLASAQPSTRVGELLLPRQL